MAPSAYPPGKSRVVSGRYPAPGTDPVADAIRERRGERGITPLDANLLHNPPVATGYSSLLGAIRTKGNLPGDIREAMILRVAAINKAAFEWIHHVAIGRKEGLSTGQLYAIRDTETPWPPLMGLLTPLQTVAIEFSDHNTRDIQVPMPIIENFKHEIRNFIRSADASLSDESLEAKTEDLYVEAAMIVASYNMVSRFLLSTDVAGISDMDVPWPMERKEHLVSLPSFPPKASPTHTIHAITLTTSPSAPWLVFANSLLADWEMWSYVVPHFLDLASSLDGGEKVSYNILLHSQRGHGRSTLPPATEGQERLTTIPLLATDIVGLFDTLSIPSPVHSIIGVSQGGAAVLAFANLYGDKTKSIVACDTSPSTPSGNKEAWEERIRLVYGPSGSTIDTEYAQKMGMGKLAKLTVPRWFPPGSMCHPYIGNVEPSHTMRQPEARSNWVDRMITNTDVQGFVEGARALGNFDIVDLESPVSGNAGPACCVSLFQSQVQKVLLLAGNLDGGGKVGTGLQVLCEQWEGASSVKFVGIDAAGHLPMIDTPEKFCEIVAEFLT